MRGPSSHLRMWSVRPERAILSHLRQSIVLRISVTAALVCFLALFVDPHEIWLTLRRTEPLAFGVLFAGAALGMAIQWRKWQRLLEFVRPSATPWEGLSSLLVGFGFGLVTPGRLGELGRGSLLDTDRAASTGAAVVDRLCSFGATVTSGLAGLVFLRLPLALLLITALCACGLLIRGRLSSLEASVERFTWLGRTAGVFLAGMRSAIISVPGGLWLSTLAWSILFNLVYLIQFFVVVGGWIEPTLELAAITPIIFALKALFPVGFMDLGVREGAAAVAFVWLNLEPSIGLSAALLVYVANVLLPGLAGIVLIGRQTGARNGTRSYDGDQANGLVSTCRGGQ